jgi:hypothetical protein
MPLYRVLVRLEGEYDDIEAEDEDDAILQASESAIEDANWKWYVEEIEDE